MAHKKKKHGKVCPVRRKELPLQRINNLTAMKKILGIMLFLLLSAAGNAQRQAPALEYVCELKVTCGKAFSVGVTAHGERVVIPITGGTFDGPLLSGTVLGGGADYQLVDRSRHRTEMEAIYNIMTADSVCIHVRNTGILYDGPDGFYFRTSPKFEAPFDSRYGWLNNAVFICEPQVRRDYISLKVWRVR